MCKSYKRHRRQTSELPKYSPPFCKWTATASSSGEKRMSSRYSYLTFPVYDPTGLRDKYRCHRVELSYVILIKSRLYLRYSSNSNFSAPRGGMSGLSVFIFHEIILDNSYFCVGTTKNVNENNDNIRIVWPTNQPISKSNNGTKQVNFYDGYPCIFIIGYSRAQKM